MNKRLVILIWHLGIGGMQKRMRDVVLEMEVKYPHWDIIFLVKQKKPSFIADQLIKRTRVKMEYFSESHFWSNSIFSVFWLAQRWLYWRPNVCLTFLDHLSVLSVIFKKFFWWIPTRVVLNESMLTSKYLVMERGWAAGWWKWLIRKSYGKTDLILVPTEIGKNDLVKNFSVLQSLIKVVPNWTLFKKGNSLADLYEVIFVGRVDREKGIDVLTGVARELKLSIKKVMIVVVGDGKDMGWFKKEVKELGLEKNIKILGHRDDVRSMLMRSKVLLLPTRNEGMPNVVLEAGVCGVPTVSSNFAGYNEVIRDGVDGFVVENQKIMVEKIILLLTKEDLRVKMGDKMRQKVLKKFSLKNQTIFISYLVGKL